MKKRKLTLEEMYAFYWPQIFVLHIQKAGGSGLMDVVSILSTASILKVDGVDNELGTGRICFLFVFR